MRIDKSFVGKERVEVAEKVGVSYLTRSCSRMSECKKLPEHRQASGMESKCANLNFL